MILLSLWCSSKVRASLLPIYLVMIIDDNGSNCSWKVKRETSRSVCGRWLWNGHLATANATEIQNENKQALSERIWCDTVTINMLASVASAKRINENFSLSLSGGRSRRWSYKTTRNWRNVESKSNLFSELQGKCMTILWLLLLFHHPTPLRRRRPRWRQHRYSIFRIIRVFVPFFGLFIGARCLRNGLPFFHSFTIFLLPSCNSISQNTLFGFRNNTDYSLVASHYCTEMAVVSRRTAKQT